MGEDHLMRVFQFMPKSGTEFEAMRRLKKSTAE